MKQMLLVVMLSRAFTSESVLQARIEPGMGAMKTADRQLVAASERPKIGDSIDLDAATAEEFPQDHRWDYVLSVRATGKLIGLEPHPATNGEIRAIIQKKRNAAAFLRNHLKPQYLIAEWHWVTRGQVGFSPMEKAVRALAQNGIRFSGKTLKSV